MQYLVEVHPLPELCGSSASQGVVQQGLKGDPRLLPAERRPAQFTGVRIPGLNNIWKFHERFGLPEAVQGKSDEETASLDRKFGDQRGESVNA